MAHTLGEHLVTVLPSSSAGKYPSEMFDMFEIFSTSIHQ